MPARASCAARSAGPSAWSAINTNTRGIPRYSFRRPMAVVVARWYARVDDDAFATIDP